MHVDQHRLRQADIFAFAGDARAGLNQVTLLFNGNANALYILMTQFKAQLQPLHNPGR